MASRHIFECPNCKHQLLIDVEGSIGGVVQDNLVLVDYRGPDGLPLTGTPVAPFATAEDVGLVSSGAQAAATPAAQATAAAKGVDLEEVKGTGKKVEVPVTTTEKVPAITKADVDKAAKS